MTGAPAGDELDEAIARHFAMMGHDEVAAAEIYTDDAVLEFVQSGERIRGRANIIAARQAYPGRPAVFEVHRSFGTSQTRAVEITLRLGGTDPHPLVAVLDFRDRLVVRERIYIAEPWEPAAYRAQWVEPMTPDHRG